MIIPSLSYDPRVPKYAPTPGARRLADIPYDDLYIGFEVRSLYSDHIGFIVGFDDPEYAPIRIEVIWNNFHTSVHPQYSYDLVEEIL